MNDLAVKVTPAIRVGYLSEKTSSTGATTVITGTVRTSKTSKRSSTDTERAVYAYLQAMRALKRTHITPEHVANALGISVSVAMAALENLVHKGVRRSK